MDLQTVRLPTKHLFLRQMLEWCLFRVKRLRQCSLFHQFIFLQTLRNPGCGFHRIYQGRLVQLGHPVCHVSVAKIHKRGPGCSPGWASKSSWTWSPTVQPDLSVWAVTEKSNSHPQMMAPEPVLVLLEYAAPLMSLLLEHHLLLGWQPLPSRQSWLVLPSRNPLLSQQPLPGPLILQPSTVAGWGRDWMTVMVLVSGWSGTVEIKSISFLDTSRLRMIRRVSIMASGMMLNWIGLDWCNDNTRPSGHISHPSQVGFSHSCLRSLNEF